MGGARAEARPGRVGPVRIGVRALQRPHRTARQPRRGEPHATPGTYLNSFYERRPLPYAEGGYGYPESGQTIINVTNGKLIRLLVEDEPFDLRYGKLHHHERVLDLQSGTLTREVSWESPAGRQVKVRSVRMVSLTQRAIAAIRYEVEVLDAPALLVVQSELVANEQLPRGRAPIPGWRPRWPMRWWPSSTGRTRRAHR